MNARDYNFLKTEIKKAEKHKLFFEKQGEDYINDLNFWKGYLNAVKLFWLQAKNNYKL